MDDPKCGATSSGSSPDHDGPHVCDSPPGHPHMRNHGCACGYAWPATDQENYWGTVSPADDPEALKREIGRMKAHFHKRCQTLTARAKRAEGETVALRGVLGDLIDWFGVPEWPPPPLPYELGKRIADLMEDAPDG